MARSAVLAIDQGTTNTKALLVGEDGTVLARGTTQVRVDHPEAGWAEQSAEAIRDSVAEAIQQAVAACPQVDIAAIAISNQRESVAIWDGETGEPLGPCVIWQCRRSAPLCASLREGGFEALIRERTGLGLDPLFSSGKLTWLLERAPGGRPIKAGTVDSWLIWNLTAGAVHATDASNASRTQLLVLDTVEWDDEIVALFGIPKAVLPEVRASDAEFGLTKGGFAGLPDGIPIRAVMGDSHAACFGHGISEPGHVKVTIGTGSSLMSPTGKRSRSTHGLSETIAWSAEGNVLYALEGNITVSGHTAAFACELLGIEDPDALTALALTVKDSDGVSFVPALAGLGAPHWNEEARGVICGMNLRTRPAHVARASIEAIAHQICDVVEAMNADLDTPLQSISADGSAACNDVLLQMIADFSGKPVRRPANTDLSALGAATMAWRKGTMRLPANVIANEFKPEMGAQARSLSRNRWRNAITKA